MMKKILFLAVIFSAELFSQSAGTGLTFLKLGVGARSIAMGESFTGVADDQSSAYYNPAALGFASRHEISLMHKEWIGETTSEFLGATILGERFNYGITILKTSVDNIEIRNQPGPPEGTFNAQNFALGGSLSARLTDDLSVGVTGKFLYEKIFTDEASGYGIDIGLFYRITDEITAGAGMLNLGSMSKLKDVPSKLPEAFRAGIGYRYPVAEKFVLLAALDGVSVIDDSKSHINAGAEVTYDQLLSLRGGYQTGYESRSISTGIGVRYGIVRFDYAFVPFTGAFSSTHTFSLSFLL
ncbi:MAG: PorV/PorQ family protein [Bacteroidota bacterium]|jgi:hypothetical protein